MIHFFIDLICRLFHRDKDNVKIVTIEMVIDASLFKQIKKRSRTDGVSEHEILRSSLRRGMHDYWLHIAMKEKEDYQKTLKLLEQYSHDNERLNKLVNQNEYFQTILKKSDKL